jgi:hypothetical protein
VGQRRLRAQFTAAAQGLRAILLLDGRCDVFHPAFF